MTDLGPLPRERGCAICRGRRETSDHLCGACRAVRDGMETALREFAMRERRAVAAIVQQLRDRAARASSAGATCVGVDGEIVRMHAAVYQALTEEADAIEQCFGVRP